MATLRVRVKPWYVPNYVMTVMTEGGRAAPLKDVDADTLAEMCDEFREEVFRKAGKSDPAVQPARIGVT